MWEVRLQGKDCSDGHGCPNAADAGMRRSGPTILLHFRHPWRSDVGRYDSREGGGRVAPGAATEINAGAIAEAEKSKTPVFVNTDTRRLFAV